MTINTITTKKRKILSIPKSQVVKLLTHISIIQMCFIFLFQNTNEIRMITYLVSVSVYCWLFYMRNVKYIIMKLVSLYFTISHNKTSHCHVNFSCFEIFQRIKRVFRHRCDLFRNFGMCFIYSIIIFCIYIYKVQNSNLKVS